MSYNVDDINVGGQLKVGTGIDVAPIQEGDEKINGSMFAEGPVVFGKPDAFSSIEGTLMVGPIAWLIFWEARSEKLSVDWGIKEKIITPKHPIKEAK